MEVMFTNFKINFVVLVVKKNQIILVKLVIPLIKHKVIEILKIKKNIVYKFNRLEEIILTNLLSKLN